MATSVREQLLELKSFALAVMSSAGSKVEELTFAPCTELDESELRAPKTALKGWRMAVNDCIEMSSHWSADQVMSMDAALRKAGIVTLSEIRRRYSTRLAAILKRGRIRGEVEYYLAVALVADTASNLSAEELVNLQALVAEFEQSAA
ncbi:hypothetical protein C1O66_04125 [Paucibacter aquatile]|uniref:Uncharacterized protein n=1 Tax=Kinneretia aquatilis TaxID=2070761 RepID=A0A2N8KTL8_9BURK|nr:MULTISPECIES: hypothetical protein [Roseateles]PND36803.1 hypothetical protein C1O66_04125 [Paucibacter aquatile]